MSASKALRCSCGRSHQRKAEHAEFSNWGFDATYLEALNTTDLSAIKGQPVLELVEFAGSLGVEAIDCVAM